MAGWVGVKPVPGRARTRTATALLGPDCMQEGPPDTRMATLLTLADRLARTVSVARALVDAGRSVDLTGLEDGVGLLCAKTLDMPVGESRGMLPAMLELRAQIDSLAARVTDKQRAGGAPPMAPARAARQARH